MTKALANQVLTPQFRAELARLIGPHNRKAHDRRGGVKRDCSSATRDDRESILLLVFAELWKLGYKLKSPTGLREKHLHALATHWHSKNLAASTLHKRFCTLRVFAGWVGKRGLVGDIETYFEDPAALKRSIVTTKSRAWEDAGVDVAAMIQQATTIDERFGLYLSLQHHFGLRVKESIQLRPLHSAFDEGVLEVYEGTKGGRPRLVPIETPAQQEVATWARKVAAKSRTGRIRWPGHTWIRAHDRFYNLMKKIKATKAQLGITAHGLRHGDAQRAYAKTSGCPSPVHGGAPGKLDWATHHYAAIKVSCRLGHNRADVLGYYVGSPGHSLRTTVLPSRIGPLGVAGVSPTQTVGV
ncbi:MAG: integrase domain-containing protein [Sulfuritalea sp.]|nr:integrase domain-containing protein [Sulfuritalea sp.]